MRESFIFYKSFYEAIKLLPKDEQLKAYEAIAEYSLTGKEPTEQGMFAVVFTMAKPQIDANIKRSENGKKGTEAGKKGGRPRKNPIGVIEKNPIGVIAETPNVNYNVNENDNYNHNDNVNYNDNENDNDNCNYDVEYGENEFSQTQQENPENEVSLICLTDEKIEKEKSCGKKEKTTEQRQMDFYNELAMFVDEYDRQTLRDFYDYWSETDKRGKMRFEKEKTWQTSLRLKRWSKNNFNNNNQNIKRNGAEKIDISRIVEAANAISE